MISDFFTLWAHQLVTEYPIPRVLVGRAATPEGLKTFQSVLRETPINYSGYRDSYSEQWIIADKTLPFVNFYINNQKTQGSKLSDLKESAEKIEVKIKEEVEKIQECCIIYAISNQEKALPYIQPRALALGISNAQLKTWFSQSRQILELLTPEAAGGVIY